MPLSRATAKRRTTKQEKVDILARLPLFERCTKRELDKVARISVEGVHSEGAHLTREGQAGGLLFVVIEGTADVIRKGRRIGRIGPGEVIGELSLIDGQPRSAEVRATSPLRVLEISRDDFRALVDGAPQFAVNLLGALARRIRATDARVPLDI